MCQRRHFYKVKWRYMVNESNEAWRDLAGKNGGPYLWIGYKENELPRQ